MARDHRELMTLDLITSYPAKSIIIMNNELPHADTEKQHLGEQSPESQNLERHGYTQEVKVMCDSILEVLSEANILDCSVGSLFGPWLQHV